MTKKFRITFIAVISLSCLLLVIFVSIKTLSRDTKNQISVITPNETKSQEINANLSLHGNTTSIEDTMSYPLQVKINNLSELGKTSLPEYGLYSLEEYLSRYISYYLGSDEKYEASYMEDSFKENVNFPLFYVTLHGDTEVKIKCIYKVVDQRYIFYSELSD